MCYKGSPQCSEPGSPFAMGPAHNLASPSSGGVWCDGDALQLLHRSRSVLGCSERLSSRGAGSWACNTEVLSLPGAACRLQEKAPTFGEVYHVTGNAPAVGLVWCDPGGCSCVWARAAPGRLIHPCKLLGLEGGGLCLPPCQIICPFLMDFPAVLPCGILSGTRDGDKLPPSELMGQAQP